MNLPELVRVEEDERRRPVAIALRRGKLDVTSIDDVWEISDEWWRAQPIARRYYKVALGSGPSITVFRDLVGGGWYRQRE